MREHLASAAPRNLPWGHALWALVLRPHHAGRVAARTSLLFAVLAAWGAWSVPIGTRFGLMLAAIDEPYESLEVYVTRWVPRGLAFGLVVCGVAAFAVIGLFAWAGLMARTPLQRAQVRLALISAVPVAPVAFLWSLASTCATMNGSLTIRRPPPYWMRSQTMGFLGSSLWVPVFLLGIAVVYAHGARTLRALYSTHCRQCGYDLRGILGACPECGASTDPA